MKHQRLVSHLSVLFATLVALPQLAFADSIDTSAARRDLATLMHSRPDGVTESTLNGIGYLIDTAERIDLHYPTQAATWLHRAEQFLAEAKHGKDPYVEQKGKIVSRAYVSPISERRQGYAVYLPPNYDPSKSYPLMVMLHGGSSNGNLFLGVTLGNNMSWLEYDEHLWDDYTPHWSPDWIVVAPDGYGQVLWRWMGEQDVLDVVDDVSHAYNVDADRVTLCGLSNGGVGAHNIGMRQAWRFANVIAMAGAPSWEQYTGGRPSEDERAMMRAVSGMYLLENAYDTHYQYHHGRVDPGPMRPAYIEELDRRVTAQHIPARGTWYDAGHDLLYIVHRHGAIYDGLANTRRDPHPHEVHVATGDYRAARQHWVTVTRIDDYPQIANVKAVAAGDTITVETSNTTALSIALRDVPLTDGDHAKLVVDGTTVYDGNRAALGHEIQITRDANGWRTGFPVVADGLEKRPGLSGPVTDAYYGRMIHVYGTHNPEHTATLKRAAERASHGWPLWLWTVQQKVVADTEVTDDMMAHATIVVYGTQGDNDVLDRMASRLPIHVDGDALMVGDHRYQGNDVGARFIYPNPLSPNSYVIVQTGVTPEAVAAGNNLPDFVPDYYVYDRRSTTSRARIIAGSNAPLTEGFFDSHWLLRTPSTSAALNRRTHHDSNARLASAFNEGGDDGPSLALALAPSRDFDGRVVPTTLPVPVAPAVPAAPQSYLAPESDPAGRAARLVTKRISSFYNFRAAIPGGAWATDERAKWSIRAQDACLNSLREAHVNAHLADDPQTPVATPVILDGAVRGVQFHSVHADRPVMMSCELAARLPELANVLREQGVTRVDVLSSYRDHPHTSFHTLGLALDMATFWTREGPLSVARHFQITPDALTCEAAAPTDRAAAKLQAIACGIAATHRFSSVLTPNYNGGHRDHFHVDARPDDERLFVR